MTGWKKFSALVELERPLIQFQNELVASGNALQELLVVAHPNVDAVRNAIESIMNQLDGKVFLKHGLPPMSVLEKRTNSLRTNVFVR